MEALRKISLGLAGLTFILLLTGITSENPLIWKPASIILSVALSFGIGAIPPLKGYQYTSWIVTAVVAGMLYPSAFLHIGGFDLRNKWLILIVVQLVMFGMGVQMSLKDFSNLASTGKGVLVGLVCQFSIMPLMGFLLTKIFNLEAEIAAGIILMGACSSGLASNVMVYLARANLVLSVTVTAMATLVAPFMTPLMMKFLAGTLIEIRFINMMMEIIKIVIVPIGAAMLHDYLKRASSDKQKTLNIITACCGVILAMLPLGLWAFFEKNLSFSALQSAEIFFFFAGAVVAGVLYHYLTRMQPRLDKLMPYFSMFGIIYFTTVTTAAGRDNLLQVGVLLFFASVFHNSSGYFLGYWLSRALGLDKNSSRAMALEVGLQNGGMASGIAGSMGKLGTVGLAAAVFSPWMNISGSILANYWQRHPLKTRKKKFKKKKKQKAGVVKV